MISRGFDASAFQGAPVWPQVKTDPNGEYGIFRSVMGATGRDPTFAPDVRGALSQGIMTLTYGFSYPKTSNAIQEAQAIVEVAKSIGGVHGLFLDTEGAGVPNSMSVAELTQFIMDWADYVHAHGFMPGSYMDLDYLQHRVDVSKLTHIPLWQAEYGPNFTIVGGWHPTFWQHTQSGSVKGISGNVDLDIFFGSMSDLQKMFDGGPPPTPGLKVTFQGKDVIGSPIRVLFNGQPIEGSQQGIVLNNATYILWKVLKQLPIAYQYLGNGNFNIAGRNVPGAIFNGDTYLPWDQIVPDQLKPMPISGGWNFTFTPPVVRTISNGNRITPQ